MFDNYYVMCRSTTILSIENNLKNIHLSATILKEFTSTYCDDNNDTFGMLFQQYTAIYVNKIYHPSLIE